MDALVAWLGTGLLLAPGAATSTPLEAADPEATGEAPFEADADDLDIDPYGWDAAARREHQERRAQTLLGLGGTAVVSAGLLLIAATVERNKPACDFGLDDCRDPPRPGVARGLYGAGFVLGGVGAALVGVGLARQHRLGVGFFARRKQAAVTFSGRF